MELQEKVVRPLLKKADIPHDLRTCFSCGRFVSRLSRRIAILEKENEHVWEVAEVLSAQVKILENERGL